MAPGLIFSSRVRNAAEPWLWAVVLLATLMAGWKISGRFAVAAGCCAIVALLAAWRAGRCVAGFRDTLAMAQARRVAAEQAAQRAQKTEALGRLTVGLLHDFNNHLTVISTNTEMLMRRLAGDQVLLMRHADAVMQGVRRAAKVTGRLLSLSQPHRAEPEAVDVVRLVGGLIDLLRRTVGAQVDYEGEPSGADWFVLSDVSRLENTLLTLMLKARDRMPQTWRLKVSAGNLSVDADFQLRHPRVVRGDYVRIAVTGADGGAAERQNRLYLDPADADLLLVNRFVHEQDGHLLWDDALDALALLLPRYRAPIALRVPPARPREGRARILVVEDDAALREVSVQTLRDAGHEVLQAPDAMEAFRLIADSGGIDLIFSDMGLPGGVTGRALAEAARNIAPHVIVLFCTGGPSPGLPAHAAVLLKPFTAAQLTAKVQAMLQGVARSEASVPASDQGVIASG